MLEVGKKYKYLGRTDETYYECLFSDKQGGLLRYNQSTFFVQSHRTQDYKEYKEPQKVETWVNVYRAQNGRLCFGGVTYSSKELAFTSSQSLVETIKVEYTETI